jgi:acyl-CoA thioesterase I
VDAQTSCARSARDRFNRTPLRPGEGAGKSLHPLVAGSLASSDNDDISVEQGDLSSVSHKLAPILHLPAFVSAYRTEFHLRFQCRARRLIGLSPFFGLALLSMGLGACVGSNTSSNPPISSRAQPTEPSLAPPLVGSYVALGASETYGVGATPHTRGYAFLVASALHSKHFLDTGIPGTTLDAGYQAELTQALDARPSLCTVFFGVNDFQAGVSMIGFFQDLHDLVGSLRQGGSQVLVIGIPDLSYVPAVARLHFGDLRQVVASWNSGMRRATLQAGGHFLDLAAYGRELATHHNYVAADGLHPSNAGHARLAQIIVTALRQQHLRSSL